MFQQLMPEGYNQELCSNIDDVINKMNNNEKILAYVLALDTTGTFYLQLSKKNEIPAYMFFKNDVSYIEKSLVGTYIECNIAELSTEKIICTRDISDATKFCYENYHVGDTVTAKVIAFIASGTMLDIGGGCCALLPNISILGGNLIKHGSELFSKNQQIIAKIKGISANGINLEIE